MTLNYSCQKDDDKISTEDLNSETNIINYGVSRDALIKSKTYKNVDIELRTIKNSTDSLGNNFASDLTSNELLDRLNLENAYFASDTITEVLNAPVRTLGSYRRTLLSLTKNQITQSYLLTYPDSTNLKEFYMTTLDGLLIQKVSIQDDGYGAVEIYNSIADSKYLHAKGEVDLCSDTIFNTCSSGNHSFENGTAGDCTYWTQSGGNPPSVLTAEFPCTGGGDNSSGSNSGGGSTTGGSNSGGGGFPNSPTNGGGGPSGLGSVDCIENLDCEDCNLPGDLDNSCSTDFYEALAMILSLNNNQSLYLVQNQILADIVNNFLVENDFSFDSKQLMNEAISNLSSFTQTNYPGIINGYPYNWWNNDQFIESTFQDPYETWKQLSEREKKLIKMFPIEANRINENKDIAFQKTLEYFGTVPGRLNGKADAFRHAFFQALNTQDINQYKTKMFADAHESEVPNRWIKEKQMDIFNNDRGIDLVVSGNLFSADVDTIASLVYDMILNGDLVYLSPINYSDPNFWDNTSTNEQGDGNHGIGITTTIIATNL